MIADEKPAAGDVFQSLIPVTEQSSGLLYRGVGTAVAAIGLNSLAGGLVHVLMIVGFFVWSRSQIGKAFSLPSTSLLLVVIPVVHRWRARAAR